MAFSISATAGARSATPGKASDEHIKNAVERTMACLKSDQADQALLALFWAWHGTVHDHGEPIPVFDFALAHNRESMRYERDGDLRFANGVLQALVQSLDQATRDALGAGLAKVSAKKFYPDSMEERQQAWKVLLPLLAQRGKLPMAALAFITDPEMKDQATEPLVNEAVTGTMAQLGSGHPVQALGWTWGFYSESTSQTFKTNYAAFQEKFTREGDYRYGNRVKQRLMEMLEPVPRAELEAVFARLQAGQIDYQQASELSRQILAPLMKAQAFELTLNKAAADTLAKLPAYLHLYALAFAWDLEVDADLGDRMDAQALENFEDRFEDFRQKLEKSGDIRYANLVKQGLLEKLEDPSREALKWVMDQLQAGQMTHAQAREESVQILKTRLRDAGKTAVERSGTKGAKLSDKGASTARDLDIKECMWAIKPDKDLLALYWLWTGDDEIGKLPDFKKFTALYAQYEQENDNPGHHLFADGLKQILVTHLGEPVKSLTPIMQAMQSGQLTQGGAGAKAAHILAPLLLRRFDLPPSLAIKLRAMVDATSTTTTAIATITTTTTTTAATTTTGSTTSMGAVTPDKLA